MKVTNYQEFNQIPEEVKKSAVAGKWLNRTYVLQSQNKFSAITLNIFELIGKQIQKIFGVDYFQKVLKTKEYKLIDCKTFKATPPAPPASEPPKAAMVAQPKHGTPAEYLQKEVKPNQYQQIETVRARLEAPPAQFASKQPTAAPVAKPSQPIAMSEQQMQAIFEQAMRGAFQSFGIDPDSPEMEAAFTKIEPALEQLFKGTRLPSQNDILAVCNQANLGQNEKTQILTIFQIIQSMNQNL